MSLNLNYRSFFHSLRFNLRALSSFYILLNCLVFSSCATIKHGDLYTLNPSAVNVQADKVLYNIIDRRDIKSGDLAIDIPFLSFPWQSRMHHRKFKDNILEEIFNREIIVTPFAEPIVIDVVILKSIQYFDAKFNSEVESVVAKILIKKKYNDLNCEGVKEIRGITESLDASVKYIDDMLSKALGKAFNLALKACVPN